MTLPTDERRLYMVPLRESQRRHRVLRSSGVQRRGSVTHLAVDAGFAEDGLLQGLVVEARETELASMAYRAIALVAGRAGEAGKSRDVRALARGRIDRRPIVQPLLLQRSEERRVGKECR